MSYSTEAIRTIALLGHTAAGKTSLVEALLQAAGMIGAAGTVERGNTVSDFDALERKAGHSLYSSIVNLNHLDTRVHLIDTPGYPDFIGQAIAALPAVETAAIVINAQTGVDLSATRMMALAQQRKLCRMIIVNKIDADHLDLPGLLTRLQEAFGKECLPINLPAAGGSKVVDCFFNPSGDADFSSVAAAHQALVDQVVEVDADLMALYLEQGEIAPEQLHAPFEQALREGHLVPVCFTSVRNGAGIAELLDVLVKLLPNPAEGNPPLFYRVDPQNPDAQKELRAEPDPARHVLAHVFKITLDPFVGKMGVFRIHQGSVQRDSLLYIGDRRKPFKVGHLFLLQGKEHVEIQQALPGDICAVAKVDELALDAVLHDAAEDEHIHLRPSEFPTPIYGLALEPKRRGDEQRLWETLQKLAAEDPCLKVEHMISTNETVLLGLGELHLRSALERMLEVYKVDVAAHPPKIAYRETIAGKAEGHSRHKKQSGGAGQFGEVFLRVEPLPRGAGFEFVDAVKGGAIPGQFIPAVEKGVRYALEAGPLAGFPVQDLRVTVYDGKSHPVDSKEIAFFSAGRKALLDAVLKARPLVLEPIVNIEIVGPESSMGDITGDLSAKRGQVSGMQSAAGAIVIIAGQVPLSELNGYQSRLHASTAGRGSYTMAFSHYDAVPPAVQQRMASQYKAAPED
ncbi:elongation factor G [Undibacterium arcticum]|uniref:Elongation factor G n=1 Tax=Undibacterium arcticum TaxID=1762892 RepID=A0ABV7F0P6_9BURK